MNLRETVSTKLHEMAFNCRWPKPKAPAKGFFANLSNGKSEQEIIDDFYEKEGLARFSIMTQARFFHKYAGEEIYSPSAKEYRTPREILQIEMRRYLNDIVLRPENHAELDDLYENV
jgi:hypothetical protein